MIETGATSVTTSAMILREVTEACKLKSRMYYLCTIEEIVEISRV